MYRDHGFILFASSLVTCWNLVTPWSPSPSPSSAGKVENNMDRRTFLANMALVTTGITGGPFSQPEWANAVEENPVLSASFDMYNIIPDASENLDPKLVKVDNMQIIETLATSQHGGAIWLGEHHNSLNDHIFQEQFIRMLHQRRQLIGQQAPPLAIGLEQVQIRFQDVLDDYINGNISLEEMRRRVEWDKRWMWDFEGYSGIFSAARELGNVRLLALNVDSEDLTLVEKGGYQGLPMEQLRKYIKDPVGFGSFAKTTSFKTYVDYVISPSYDMHQRLGLLKYTIAGEKMDEDMSFRNFLSGRILWDEGMASAAYNWMLENERGLLVGLVGADHVKFANGIPERFSRLSGGKFDSTTLVINPTLIDSRPSGSVSNIPGADSSKTPEMITLQLRYLKDGVDPSNPELRGLPESTGGVLSFADFIVVT